MKYTVYTLFLAGLLTGCAPSPELTAVKQIGQPCEIIDNALGAIITCPNRPNIQIFDGAPITGPVGPTGQTGPQGAAGPTGQTGPQGIAGVCNLPKKICFKHGNHVTCRNVDHFEY